MVVAGAVAFCVLLLVAAFVFPRLSRHPERAGKGVMGVGSKAGGKAPGKLRN